MQFCKKKGRRVIFSLTPPLPSTTSPSHLTTTTQSPPAPCHTSKSFAHHQTKVREEQTGSPPSRKSSRSDRRDRRQRLVDKRSFISRRNDRITVSKYNKYLRYPTNHPPKREEQSLYWLVYPGRTIVHTTFFSPPIDLLFLRKKSFSPNHQKNQKKSKKKNR